MKPFTINPLYRSAGQAAKDAARRAFGRGEFGHLAAELKGAASGKTIRDAVGHIERFAKFGNFRGKMLDKLLSELGPAGRVLAALAQPKGKHSPKLQRELQSALDFLTAYSDDGDVLEAMARLLEGKGYRVNKPGEQPGERARGVPDDKPGTKTQKVQIDGRNRRFPKDHPILTGEQTLTPRSSNVYSFAYDYDQWLLYVRFKEDGKEGKKNSPGSLYQYADIPPRLFLSMLSASSKGGWVWDNLRIRGTLSGHQKPYRLVGITGGYVPRQATFTAKGEAFVPREVRGLTSGSSLHSSKPYQLVRPMMSAGPGKFKGMR